MRTNPTLSRLKSVAIVVCIVLALIASSIHAQDSLTYGSAADGSINSAGDAVTYNFRGTKGDLVFARVIYLNTTLNTTLSLIAADGSESITSANGTLTHRLSASGNYRLVITGQNGTMGEFIVRLDARTGIPLPLALGQITSAQFAVDGPPQTYTFAQHPNIALLLTVSADNPAFRFSTEVRDAQGQVVAYFNPQMRSTVLTIDVGVSDYDLTITAADPALTGTVLLDLETEDASAPTTVVQPTPASGSTPVSPTAAAPGNPPVSTTGAPSNGSVYCHVSTNGSANIRSAPNDSAPVIERLTRSKAVEVIGLSADGAWFAVRLPTQVGWIAKQVARQIEPCVNVAVLNP